MFDTVITRDVARPKDLFVRLGEACRKHSDFAAWQSVEWDRFYEYRTEAERQARQKTTREDVTIWEVYQQLAVMLGLDEDKTRSLVALEIELEKLAARPVPSILAEIAAARSPGRNVIFISDMYLPADVLQSILEACGAFQPGDKLYISSEVGFTKASSNLFRHCLAQERLSPGQLHHWGDNEHADIHRAQELGIQTSHFTGAHLNRYEQTIAGDDGLSLSDRSLVAGASRLARLHCPHDDEHRQTIWNTGASIAGPILASYVAWILDQARRQGIPRLYFVARDGQILVKLARIISRRLDMLIDCRYLYGSRQAWHLPAFSELGDFEGSWILSSTDHLSLRTLLRRVDLVPEDIAGDLAAAGLNYHPKTNLSAIEREKLFSWVREGHLTERIRTKAELRRGATLAYLRQEGLFDPIDYGIVDIGWNGRLQRSLGTLLALAGHDRSLDGYYFGIRARMAPRPGDRMYAYFWDSENPSPRDDLGFRTRVMMEIFSAADHGGVVGYSSSHNEEVVPCLHEGASASVISWGVEAQHAAILEYVAQLDEDQLACLADPEWRGVSAALLKQFFDHPSVAEARVYGSFPVAEDQNEASIQRLAQPFVWTDVGRTLLGRPSSHHHNEWQPAAWRLTPPMIAFALRVADRVRRSTEQALNHTNTRAT